MNKYLVIGLMALGLVAFTPQPAKAGVHFGIFVGPPAYYYPGLLSGLLLRISLLLRTALSLLVLSPVALSALSSMAPLASLRLASS
jgi:hypothetical protein